MTDSQTAGGHTSRRPSAPLLHFCMMLTGIATALLGPILPLLSHHWQLQDQQTGLLLLAQFIGSGSGGLTILRHLHRSLTFGLAAAAIGFMGFAFAPALPLACISLLIGGWGCGQVITAGNIVAGRRYGTNRGSAIALLNFTWSFGAMLSPLLTAWLTPHFPLQTLLAIFASLFAIALAGILIEFIGQPAEVLSKSDNTVSESSLALPPYLYFIALLLFYGGVETSLSGWLTTYALRYGGRTLVHSEYITLIFWASLTIGRALSSLLMLRIRELPLQRAGLIVTAICTVGLATASTGVTITFFSVLLGLSLAPFFPATFSILMGDRPSARQAGVVLAMSGFGAAILPSLMGVVSTRSGSLQIALTIPLAAVVVLLVLSIFLQSSPRPYTA